MGRFSDWLLSQQPISGRIVNEDGGIINEADLMELRALIDPAVAALQGRAFIVQTRFDVAAGASYDVSFKSSLTKHTAVIARTLTGAQGPIQLDNVIGGTVSGGTTLTAANLFTLKPTSDLVAKTGVTITGGVVVPNDYEYSTGVNRATGTASPAGAYTILPPALDIALRITNDSAQSVNSRLAIVFIEFILPARFL